MDGKVPLKNEATGGKSEDPIDGAKDELKSEGKKEGSDEEIEEEEERSWRRGYDAE